MYKHVCRWFWTLCFGCVYSSVSEKGTYIHIYTSTPGYFPLYSVSLMTINSFPSIIAQSNLSPPSDLSLSSILVSLYFENRFYPVIFIVRILCDKNVPPIRWSVAPVKYVVATFKWMISGNFNRLSNKLIFFI